jgi:acetyltransferase-like isoleucine patch superfamily enzyme
VSLGDFFAHPQSLVESQEVGGGTRIWAFTHVMKGVRVGTNCNVGEHCFLESGVVVGNDVVVKNGVSLWEGVTVEDRVFLGPNCVFTNDLFPRSKVVNQRLQTWIREGASIGANATILCGIEIGRFSLVGAGAVVLASVPDFALVVGNPAHLQGYVCCCGEKLTFSGDQTVGCSCKRTYQKQGSQVCLLVPSELSK